MDDELTDLQHLVKHPGFLRLQAYQQRYWTDEVASLLRTAVNDRDDLAALHRMRQVIAAKDATERLLLWPAERIRRLEGRQAQSLTETARSNPPTAHDVTSGRLG